MAYYEAVADAARIAEGRMRLFREALMEKARMRIAREAEVVTTSLADGSRIDGPDPARKAHVALVPKG